MSRGCNVGTPTPRPAHLYTSAWLASSSRASKNDLNERTQQHTVKHTRGSEGEGVRVRVRVHECAYLCQSGPTTNVIRWPKNRTEKAPPIFLYVLCTNATGPLLNARNVPKMGMPSEYSGGASAGTRCSTPLKYAARTVLKGTHRVSHHHETGHRHRCSADNSGKQPVTSCTRWCDVQCESVGSECVRAHCAQCATDTLCRHSGLSARDREREGEKGGERKDVQKAHQ